MALADYEHSRIVRQFILFFVRSRLGVHHNAETEYHLHVEHQSQRPTLLQHDDVGSCQLGLHNERPERQPHEHVAVQLRLRPMIFLRSFVAVKSNDR